MLSTRTFNVVIVGSGHGAGPGVTANPDHVVSYDGTEMVISTQ